jgi:hypothetical protein
MLLDPTIHGMNGGDIRGTKFPHPFVVGSVRVSKKN